MNRTTIEVIALRRYKRSMLPNPTIRKIPADQVRYGSDISRNGKYIWAAFDGEQLVCVGDTAGEARRRYRRALSHYFTKRNEPETGGKGIKS